MLSRTDTHTHTQAHTCMDGVIKKGGEFVCIMEGEDGYKGTPCILRVCLFGLIWNLGRCLLVSFYFYFFPFVSAPMEAEREGGVSGFCGLWSWAFGMGWSVRSRLPWFGFSRRLFVSSLVLLTAFCRGLSDNLSPSVSLSLSPPVEIARDLSCPGIPSTSRLLAMASGRIRCSVRFERRARAKRDSGLVGGRLSICLSGGSKRGGRSRFVRGFMIMTWLNEITHTYIFVERR